MPHEHRPKVRVLLGVNPQTFFCSQARWNTNAGKFGSQLRPFIPSRPGMPCWFHQIGVSDLEHASPAPVSMTRSVPFLLL